MDEYFYEQTWFSVLATFFVMILLGGGYFLYVQQQNELAIQRNEMASDLHDEVSNALNNINIVADQIAHNNPNIASKEIASIQRMSSNAIEQVKDVIWAVDANYDAMKHLIFVMEDFLDEVVRSQNIPVIFGKKNIDTSKKIKVLIRRNLLLIFKEAISNAVKHTQPTAIKVFMENKLSTFEMSIINEFEHKKTTTNSTGKGVPNMKERVTKIYGQLTIEEAPHRFSIKVRLNRKI